MMMEPQEIVPASGARPTDFDFKDIETLQRYLSAQGRLHSAKRSGLSARAQRRLKRAIKYARYLALLPYTN